MITSTHVSNALARVHTQLEAASREAMVMAKHENLMNYHVTALHFEKLAEAVNFVMRSSNGVLYLTDALEQECNS